MSEDDVSANAGSLAGCALSRRQRWPVVSREEGLPVLCVRERRQPCRASALGALGALPRRCRRDAREREAPAPGPDPGSLCARLDALPPCHPSSAMPISCCCQVVIQLSREDVLHGMGTRVTAHRAGVCPVNVFSLFLIFVFSHSIFFCIFSVILGVDKSKLFEKVIPVFQKLHFFFFLFLLCGFLAECAPGSE